MPVNHKGFYILATSHRHRLHYQTTPQSSTHLQRHVQLTLLIFPPLSAMIANYLVSWQPWKPSHKSTTSRNMPGTDGLFWPPTFSHSSHGRLWTMSTLFRRNGAPAGARVTSRASTSRLRYSPLFTSRCTRRRSVEMVTIRNWGRHLRHWCSMCSNWCEQSWGLCNWTHLWRGAKMRWNACMRC